MTQTQVQVQVWEQAAPPSVQSVGSEYMGG